MVQAATRPQPAPPLVCVSCHTPLPEAYGPGLLPCPACGLDHVWEPGYLKCQTDDLLFKRFRKQYLLNKVLNNNAYLSYLFVKERSLSLPHRRDVMDFRDYIRERLADGPLLDVGCGILPLPGYLNIEGLFEAHAVFGLDPIDDRAFQGFRVVGHSEFTPFEDGYFGTLIFGTSLDHVVSVPDTLAEARRILRPGGRIVVWMSDRHQGRLNRLGRWIKTRLESLRQGYPVDRFGIYHQQHLVLYIPRRAVDAYHSFSESPDKLDRIMRRQGFTRMDLSYVNPKQVFLCYERT